MGPVHNVHEQWCSISKFCQWMSEQKDFHSGAGECEPAQWNAWRLVQGLEQTTGDWTAQLVRLPEALPDAQSMPNSMMSSLHARLYKQIWKISPETSMPECHANLLLTDTPCQLPEKATLARIMCNWLTKIQWMLDWVCVTVLKEGRTVHKHSPMTVRRMLHFLLDTLTSALTCLLELGLRNWALSLGEDYERITLQCHTETPVLAVLKWAVWRSNIAERIIPPICHCT